MGALREWALAVCAAAVAGSLVRMAAPNGETERVLRLTVSLFFLCALLSPVLTGALSGELEPPPAVENRTQYNTQALEQSMQAQMEQSFLSSMQSAVRAVLTEMGVSPREILININTNGQDSISIREVRVTLEEQERGRAREIERELEEKTGQRPVLIFGEQSEAAAGG